MTPFYIVMLFHIPFMIFCPWMLPGKPEDKKD